MPGGGLAAVEGDEHQIPLPLELITLITKNLCLSEEDITNLWKTSKEFRNAVKLSAPYRETMRPTLEHRKHVKAFTEQIQGRSERNYAYQHRYDERTRIRIEEEDEETALALIQLLNDASDSWYNVTDMQIPREVLVFLGRLLPPVNENGLNNNLLFRDAVTSALKNYLHDLLTAVCTHLTHVREGDLVQGSKRTFESELPGVKLFLHEGTSDGVQVISVGTPTNHVFIKLPGEEWRHKWKGNLGTVGVFADSIKAILMVPFNFSIGDEVQVSREGGVVHAKVNRVHANGSVDVVYDDNGTEGKSLTPEKDQYFLRAAFDDTALD